MFIVLRVNPLLVVLLFQQLQVASISSRPVVGVLITSDEVMSRGLVDLCFDVITARRDTIPQFMKKFRAKLQPQLPQENLLWILLLHSTQITNNLHCGDIKSVFLQTARAVIYAPSDLLTSLEICLILDGGCQNPYISEHACNLMKLEAVREQELSIATFRSRKGSARMEWVSEVTHQYCCHCMWCLYHLWAVDWTTYYFSTFLLNATIRYHLESHLSTDV